MDTHALFARRRTSVDEARKGLFIKQSFSDDFVDLIDGLHKKYGDDVFAVQGIATEDTDIVKFSQRFFKSASTCVADTSVDSNANVREKNITQYNHEVGKAVMKLNSLYLMYTWVKRNFHKESASIAVEKVINGELFINDMVNFNTCYCYAFDLSNLLHYGMNFFSGNMKIHPPKRSDSFIALVIQTTAYISNQILGACSYPDFFVALDWFYRREMGDDYATKMDEKEVWYKIRNQFQNLIYSLNYPFRGSQSAFSNLSILDMGFLKKLFSSYIYPDKSHPHLESVMGLSKKFFEYYTEINGKEGIFTFPIMTIAISVDEKTKDYVDEEFVDWSAKANHAKALANIYVGDPNTFSSCCRMRSEVDKVADVGYQNSFGVGGVSIGSHRVAGLNLARIAILEKDDPDIVEKDLDVLHHILVSHRRLLQHRIDGGTLPLYNAGWININRQYSTIGFVGAYEYVVNKGHDIKTEEGAQIVVDLLKKIESKASAWQVKEKDQHYIYNIEQIPAESMAVRLAQLDMILGYNPNKTKLYSNQYIPLIEDASIYERFKIQGKIDSITSGGAIMHINVDDSKPLSARQFRRLIEQAKTSKTVYFAVNYAYCECENSHYVVGMHDECPACKGKIVNIFTRVVGFLTPVSSWNSVRRNYEFPLRKFYKNEDAASIKEEEPATV